MENEKLASLANKFIEKYGLVLCYNLPEYLDKAGHYLPSNPTFPSLSRYFVVDEYEVPDFPDEATRELVILALEKILLVSDPSERKITDADKACIDEWIRAPQGYTRILGWLPTDTGLQRRPIDIRSHFIIDEDNELPVAVVSLLKNSAGIIDPWDDDPEYFSSRERVDAGYLQDRIAAVLSGRNG